MPGLVKDGTKLISGNMWGQAISFLAYLVLTRFYGPDQFALFTIFYSYIEIFIILSTCKYEVAIVVADSEHEAAAVSRLALRINAIVSLALLAIVAVLCLFPMGGNLQWVGENPWVALIIPPMVFLCGTTRVYTFLFNRAKQFGQIALSEVITSTVGVALKVIFGLFSAMASIGLPLGTMLGKAAGNINYLMKMHTLSLPKDISHGDMKAVARKHSYFPRFTMPKELLNSLSYNLPILWLAQYFDRPEIGLYSLALTITMRPINMLNTAFEKLFYVRWAEKVRNHESIIGDMKKFIAYLNMAALPAMVLLFFTAEPLMVLLFGSKWVGCGLYVQLLLPWVWLMLTATSLMFVSNIFKKQRTEFRFFVALLALRIAALYAGYHYHSFALAIGLFAASSAAINLAILIWEIVMVRHYEHER